MMRGKARGLVLVALLLAGCDTWFGETEPPPLPGQRVSVLEHQRVLTVDPQARLEAVVLPPPVPNLSWPQAGGNAQHAMQHLEAGDVSRPIWQASVGEGISDAQPLLPPPVVADGRIFALDTDNQVTARDYKTGRLVWEVDLAAKEDDDDVSPGGIAYDDGRLIVTTGYGKVIALDAARGKELWRRQVGYPVHAAPTIAGGRAYVITVENQLRALNLSDGTDAFPPYQALAEGARLVGSANPAVDAGLVVAPFSSGELVALRADNGRPVWVESLAPSRRTDEITALAQIRARPVISDLRVYAISAGGILAAFDLRTGQRLWERDIGGLQTPWLAGRFLFLITNDNQLICVTAETGRIHWVTSLPTYQDEKERKNPILWSGPVLASDRLLVVSSDGRMAAVSPFDGRVLERRRVDVGVRVPPVIADGALFLLDNDGELSAYR